MSEDDFKAEQQKESSTRFNLPLKRVTLFEVLKRLEPFKNQKVEP
jgi:hypothetical protein